MTEHERHLLEDCDEISHGDIFDIQAGGKSPVKVLALTDKSFNFVQALRRAGKFQKVSVYDGEPVSAEYQTATKHGFACLKKLRF